MAIGAAVALLNRIATKKQFERDNNKILTDNSYHELK